MDFLRSLDEKYPKVFEKILDGDKNVVGLIFDKKEPGLLPQPLLITPFGAIQFGPLEIGLEGTKDQMGLLRSNAAKIADVLKNGGGDKNMSFGIDGRVLCDVLPLVGRPDPRFREAKIKNFARDINPDVDAFILAPVNGPDIAKTAEKIFRPYVKSN